MGELFAESEAHQKKEAELTNNYHDEKNRLKSRFELDINKLEKEFKHQKEQLKRVGHVSTATRQLNTTKWRKLTRTPKARSGVSGRRLAASDSCIHAGFVLIPVALLLFFILRRWRSTSKPRASPQPEDELEAEYDRMHALL